VFVLLYREPTQFLELNSAGAERWLAALHPNIHVLRHGPGVGDILWSHHEKVVVVDQRLAFVGGLDLTYGRYDEPTHPVADPGGALFPGLDYYNPGVYAPDHRAFQSPFLDAVDRGAAPRMPWHDAHCAVAGAAARDVAMGFVQRWNRNSWELDAPAAPIAIAPLSDLSVPPPPPLAPAPAAAAAAPASPKMPPQQPRAELRSPLSAAALDAMAAAARHAFSPPASATAAGWRSADEGEESDAPSSPRPRPAWHRSASFSFLPSLALARTRAAGDAGPAAAAAAAAAATSEASAPSGACGGWAYLTRGSPLESMRPCAVQVLRSLGQWSGGAFTETSAYQAMLRAIFSARRSLYIEAQFFISSTGSHGGAVTNLICKALIERLARAIGKRENFRAVILVPVHPEGDVANSLNVSAVLNWQFRTLCRAEGSLLQRLKSQFPDVELADYVSIFSLRTWGEVGGRVTASMVYVHSKLMIVDDRVLIVGSANINDRSLVGSRDSEVCLRVTERRGAVQRPGEPAYWCSQDAAARYAEPFGELPAPREGRRRRLLSRLRLDRFFPPPEAAARAAADREWDGKGGVGGGPCTLAAHRPTAQRCPWCSSSACGCGTTTWGCPRARCRRATPTAAAATASGSASPRTTLASSAARCPRAQTRTSAASKPWRRRRAPTARSGMRRAPRSASSSTRSGARCCSAFAGSQCSTRKTCWPTRASRPTCSTWNSPRRGSLLELTAPP
jgi:phosphatidylserine/phosphatidylglycerophosphate/cardiolipin synthase-like enzyme